ncbi:MAG: zinc metallopeptidase [Rhodospirillales bacterium]|nr:zinc metallopeptidase [Rhodospirillales bacterium]
MLWRGGRRSENIEDRRGAGGGGFRFPTGGRGMPGGFRFPGGGRMPGRRTGGIGGVGLIILFLVALAFGFNPLSLFQEGGGGPDTSGFAPQSERQAPDSPAMGDMREFVSVVLGSTEDTWHEIFRKMGRTYEEPTLVLFSGSVASACGRADASVGPFYCPADRKVYLDFSFFDDLRNRFGAPGDFAQAYVIAHEIGHHVQNQLGISEQVEAMRGRLSRSDANRLSVMTELQADCFAGVWANHAGQGRQFLEAGDIEEGIRAAGAIGDDRLQRQSQGFVVPDAFTHGSSQQRVAWFKQGLARGTIEACDTFNDETL